MVYNKIINLYPSIIEKTIIYETIRDKIDRNKQNNVKNSRNRISLFTLREKMLTIKNKKLRLLDNIYL